MAVLSSPMVLLESALNPRAVLSPPVVLLRSASNPTAVFSEPVVLFCSADLPMPVLTPPVVFSNYHGRFMEVSREFCTSFPPIGTLPSNDVIECPGPGAITGRRCRSRTATRTMYRSLNSSSALDPAGRFAAPGAAKRIWSRTCVGAG